MPQFSKYALNDLCELLLDVSDFWYPEKFLVYFAIPRNTSSRRTDEVKVDFESMTIQKSYHRAVLRRLSTLTGQLFGLLNEKKN